MKPTAILYTSASGHTRQYAELFGEKAGLPVYSLEEACAKLPSGCPVIYMGWIRASHIMGYARAVKRFTLCAACGVGLCDTGTLKAEVRKATGIAESIPLFTMQGGMEHSSLRGISRFVIAMLTKGLAAKKQRTAQDDRMLELLRSDASYVSESNLSALLDWYAAKS